MSEGSREQERKEINTAYFLGNIREDISFLGLRMHELLILAVSILVVSLLLFLMQLPMPVTLISIISFVSLLSANFLLRWPYRIKRFYKELYSKDGGDGEDLSDYLDVLEDGWLYREGMIWTVLMKVTPPQTMAWNQNLLNTQSQRIGSFKELLRLASSDHVVVDIDSEQVPDFQYAQWDAMRDAPAPTPGIKQLRDARLDFFEEIVEQDLSMTYDYTVALTFNEFHLKLLARDDEPPGMTKEETKRYRTIMVIKEKVKLLMASLEQSGHTYRTLAGYNMTERLGRFLDYYGWREWKLTGGLWEELVQEQDLQADDTVVNLIKEELSMSDEKGHPPTDTEDELISEETLTHILNTLDEPQEAVESAISMEGDEVEEEEGKSPQKRFWGFSGAKKLLGSLLMIPGLILPEAKRLMQLLIELGQKRKQKQLSGVVPAQPDAQEAESATELPETQLIDLPDALILTSSVSSGKSLLTANIALASTLAGQPCQIIDLSLQQGTVTVLNTLRHEERMNGWKVWELSRVAGLKIWTPMWNKANYPSVQSVMQVIDQQMKLGPVLIDMPWNYPDRDALLARYQSVAVVDSDYHHWLQMSKDMAQFDGQIWMNQVPRHLLRPLTQMIRETWKAPITAIFPIFPEATECLLQGTPLAMDHKHQSHFTPNVKEAQDEATQTIA